LEIIYGSNHGNAVVVQKMKVKYNIKQLETWLSLALQSLQNILLVEGRAFFPDSQQR